jgi:hypothetical protein
MAKIAKNGGKVPPPSTVSVKSPPLTTPEQTDSQLLKRALVSLAVCQPIIQVQVGLIVRGPNHKTPPITLQDHSAQVATYPQMTRVTESGCVQIVWDNHLFALPSDSGGHEMVAWAREAHKNDYRDIPPLPDFLKFQKSYRTVTFDKESKTFALA